MSPRTRANARRAAASRARAGRPAGAAPSRSRARPATAVTAARPGRSASVAGPAGSASAARPGTSAFAAADALHSAAIHLLRRLRRVDERAGISAAKLSALSVLVFAGPARLTDLARAEQVRPPTMTRLVVALEKDGLVRRRQDLADRRAVRLEATRKGTRMLHEGRRRRVTRLAAALRRLPAADRAALHRAAVRIEALSRVL